MRAPALTITILLLLVPLAAGLAAPTPRAPALPALVPALPADLPDAQLMLLLARLDHPDARLVPRAQPAAGDTLGKAAARVGQQAGVALAAEDIARYDALDPRIKAPLLTLFVTIEQANGMVTEARADLSDAEAARMIALRDAGLEGGPEYRALTDQLDATTLINAGILVTDTVESIVVPALQTAVTAGAWPAAGVWDPVGVLRLGSTGNDFESLDRIVQIDPSGNDEYRNNAGGSTLFYPLTGSFNILTPISVSIDFLGNDKYIMTAVRGSNQGAADLGIGFGLLYDLTGSEYYQCPVGCQGYGNGLARDFAGNDERIVGRVGAGSGEPLAILRDDAGSDPYRLGSSTGGYAGTAGMVGLLWDRAGLDFYNTTTFSDQRVGWGDGDGRGLFADEGDDEDFYGINLALPVAGRHGCNDCTWARGNDHNLPRPGGRGNDNAGGLRALLLDVGP